MNSDLGVTLQELRKKNGLSQEELADKLGVSRQAVSKWERGEALPDIENLIALAKLYGVSLDDLVGNIKKEENVDVDKKLENKEEPIEGEVVSGHIHSSKKTKKELFAEWFSGSFSFMLCTIAFLVLGIGWNLWHPGWVVFLLIPVIPSFVSSIKHKSPKYFCYPVLLLGVYILIGHFTGQWHPWWLLFISIPLYYILCEGIDILTGRKTR